MKTLEIVRTHTSSIWTYSTMAWEGIPFGVSMELPWKLNKVRISCIPSGVYIAKRYKRHGKIWVWQLKNVPGRTHIQIHIANIAIKELLGCIATGEKFEPLQGQDAVLESGHAFKELMKLTKNEKQIRVVIRNCINF